MSQPLSHIQGKSIGSGKKLFKHLQKQYEADHQILEQAKAYFQRHLNAEKRASTNDQTLMNDSSESDVGAISTSPEFGSISSFCDSKGMNEQQTRKMRFYLISTLNAAFPDYDFSSIRPAHFTQLPLSVVIAAINSKFQGIGGEHFASSLSKKLWSAIEEMVGPTGLTLSKSGTLIGQHLTKQKKQLSEWYDAVEIFSYEPNADASAGDPYEDDEDESVSIWSFFYFFFNRKLKRMVFFTMRSFSLISVAESAEEPDFDDLRSKSSEAQSETSFSSSKHPDVEQSNFPPITIISSCQQSPLVDYHKRKREDPVA